MRGGEQCAYLDNEPTPLSVTGLPILALRNGGFLRLLGRYQDNLDVEVRQGR